MAKRKQQKRGKSLPGRGFSWPRRQKVDLEALFEQVDRLVERGRAEEAVALLEPYLAADPNTAELHYYLAYARAQAGDLWGSLASYERALDLSHNLSYWLPLATLYLELGQHAHALRAFRQVLKHRLVVPDLNAVHATIASLEEHMAETAQELGVTDEKMEQGLRYLEAGRRALNSGNFEQAIAVNRNAIKQLGNWPPPHNNLSLALFFDGQPEEAIEVTRRVLSAYPDNLQALSNIIRYLAWSGREAEAREYWPSLQVITPIDPDGRLKKAEAAAILGQDEAVYELLSPLAAGEIGSDQPPGSLEQTQLFLAVAEANTGRVEAAKRRMKRFKDRSPWIKDLLAALQRGQSGPGYADRFPYFHSSEIIPRAKMEEFIELVGRQGKLPEKKFRSQIETFARRYPQLALMAEKLIWEEGQPKAGIAILTILGTPAAYAALRRFGTSQAGDDDLRMQALLKLVESKEVGPDERLRVWNRGQWQEVQLRQYEISDEPEVAYSPQVVKLLNRGLRAFQQQKESEAERLFKQALELEPRAKEAYNNLGTIYSRRGELEQAKAMLHKAVEIDPTYVFPRGNLALFLLGDDDVEGAEAMLAPLADETRFQPQEMAFFSYVQARLLLYRDEYDAARRSLEIALEIIPDYEPAKELLERLELMTKMRANWESFRERQHERDRAKRARQQRQLTTAEPTLTEALPLYSKEVLVAMGRLVIRWGGWSAYKKAALIELLSEELTDPNNLARIVAALTDQEREALRQVMAGGGAMAWAEFERRYGNDLEESPYWQYHTPKTVMGRLRLHGLLVEATIADQPLIVVPAELRQPLTEVLG